MGNVLVAQRDPLEEVADFQKQRPTMRPLVETPEGTALAAHQPPKQGGQAAERLQQEFSGELGVKKPGTARPGASATLFLPRGDSAARGLVEDSAGAKSYVVVQNVGPGDPRQDRLYFATRRGVPPSAPGPPT